MTKLTLLNDYLTLCKPRVVLLMLVTSWIGMYLASPVQINWQSSIFGTIGIAFAAAAGAIVNHLMDRHIDSKMLRTATRPIAAGKISPQQALLFAIILAMCAACVLLIYVNVLTTLLTFASLLGYAVIYTMFLKRATPQNIVIGGLSGAMPPLLGWTAITGAISPYAILLVLIIYTWTPPHFWALSIYRVNDYAAAQIPMLPVTHGVGFTKLYLLLYTFLLLAVSTLPFAVGLAGWLYFGTALILGSIFIYLAIRLYFAVDRQEHITAIRTFNFSIIYLLILFLSLLFDIV